MRRQCASLLCLPSWPCSSTSHLGAGPGRQAGAPHPRVHPGGQASAGCQLLAPPQGLMHSSGPVGRHRQLVLVLEGDLYLIPFALLKGSSSNEYLYERFALIAVPSIRSLSPQAKVSQAAR